ncbi:pirin family protein [Dickeya fangzhongdai]|uniref:pirin family protein n=1 Tax=Dickeya fangzhongdai TaxID=1778540 RepID=UPI0023E3C734|nr:pirin family protein [Dickeya fangzhongdai]WES88994.1 pirin family protein [Dickeya fangzhongdai]
MAHHQAFSATTRPIVHRTSGQRLGPLTRMMSPGDLGQRVKPFVFLDLFESVPSTGTGFRPHPHSGIATLTTFLEGSMTYGDTTGKQGAMTAGSVEWMRAGSGVWHAGEPAPDHMMRGYQLWIALPPSLELAPAQSLYLEAEQIARDGPARILLGRYGDKVSPIPLPVSITYLHVRLADGERWTYQPAADHDTAWLALNSGKLHVGGTVLERELAVFAQGNEAIGMTAEGDVELVIGSAANHPHPLVMGAYSVHTCIEALAEGERTINQLQHSPAFAALNRREARWS